MTGGGSAARIAELERQLYGRPDAAPPDGVALGNRADAVEELRHLREMLATPEVRTHLDAAAGGRNETRTHAPPPIPADLNLPPVTVRRRVALVGITCLAVILTGILVASLTTAPGPPALAAFDTPLSPLDQVRSEALRALGLPLLDDGRVLKEFAAVSVQVVVFRTASGTAELLRNGAEPVPYAVDSVPSVDTLYDLPRAPETPSGSLRDADVCAWVTDRSYPITGRCASLAEFTAEGLSFDAALLSGGANRVEWQPSGAIELIPIPPPTVEQ